MIYESTTRKNLLGPYRPEPSVPCDEALGRATYCKAYLYSRGLITKEEKQKISKRIDKWRDEKDE